MENNNMSMEELLAEESNSQVRVGDIVEGEVVQIEERRAFVDIQQPTEGEIYLNHFTNDKSVESFAGLLKVGDIIKAKVTKVEDTKNGQSILLSCLDLIKDEALMELESKVKESPVDVKATVVKINEKSYELKYNGIRLFMSIKDVKDKLSKGDSIDVRITEVNVDKKFAFCSNYLLVKEAREKEHAEYVAKKEAEHKAYEEARQAEMESLHVGDEVEGSVAKILAYGILVKLDKAQGLVKMRDLDHKFVKDPTEIVKVGDTIKVKVVKKENGKLEFSRKACIPSPYQLFVKEHKVGDTIKAKVINKLPFGLLCEVAPELTGLLHRSEFSWNPNDNLMASTLIGDEVEVAILKLDDETEKVSLSKKALIDNPWARVEAQVGDEVEAVITEVSSNGLKVEAFGVDGFIPSRCVVLDGKSSKIDDYYASGDKIKALVSEINTKRWILTLDQKAYKNKEERAEFDKYMNAQEEEAQTPTLGDLLGEELKK